MCSAIAPDHQRRLGRVLDYEKLKRDVRSDVQMRVARYAVASPFVNERVDRANPVDRVRWNGRWFMSGCVVSRQTRDNHRVYSQIVRLYRGPTDFYCASLLDLRLRNAFAIMERQELKFDPLFYEAGEPTELLMPLARLTYIRPTPTAGPFFNPHTMLTEGSMAELQITRRLRQIVDQERDYQTRTTAPNGVNPQQLP